MFTKYPYIVPPKKNILRQDITYSVNLAPVGRTERWFLQYLKKPTLLIARQLEVKVERIHFIPDFILNKRFVIEIDEPYTTRGSPCHCLEPNHNGHKDKTLSMWGFWVIRIAEYQIAKYPQECCDFIYQCLRGDKPSFSGKIIKRWNKKDSLRLSKKKYRDKYLKKYLNKGFIS